MAWMSSTALLMRERSRTWRVDWETVGSFQCTHKGAVATEHPTAIPVWSAKLLNSDPLRPSRPPDASHITTVRSRD